MKIIQVIKLQEDTNVPILILDDEGYVWEKSSENKSFREENWEKIEMNLPYELKPIMDRR